MATLTLEGVTKTYRGGHTAVKEIDLEVADGELLTLVGPSGCGKSTLLRLIAGLELPTSGRILINGRDVTNSDPQSRDLAMVFQSYALYPHKTVYENLAYALRIRRFDRREIDARIRTTAEALGLSRLLQRRPAQLSGGERQRVAIGRALVREPTAFLLDEPLSNLDPALRVHARAELLRLRRRLDATVIYVTHDQEDAMTLGTRVAVMREGRVIQVAPPLTVYERPSNTFVATFIGSPPMNLIPASKAGIDAPDGTLAGIRPHDVVLGDGPIEAVVDVAEVRGHDAVLHLRLDDAEETSLLAVIEGPVPSPGARIRVQWRSDRIVVFDSHGQLVKESVGPAEAGQYVSDQ